MPRQSGVRQFVLRYPCGCSFVAWKSPLRNAETYGWQLCPDHMLAYHRSRESHRREFRIKHPCRCYYVVWMTSDGGNGFGWGYCDPHLAEYQRFQEGA